MTTTSKQNADRAYDQVMALVESERVREARRVLETHKELIPHSEKLSGLARALAPSTVSSYEPSEDEREDLFASAQWYYEHRDDPQWRGMSVAVRDGEVVTAAATHEALRARLRELRGTLGGVSVFSL